MNVSEINHFFPHFGVCCVRSSDDFAFSAPLAPAWMRTSKWASLSLHSRLILQSRIWGGKVLSVFASEQKPQRESVGVYHNQLAIPFFGCLLSGHCCHSSASFALSAPFPFINIWFFAIRKAPSSFIESGCEKWSWLLYEMLMESLGHPLPFKLALNSESLRMMRFQKVPFFFQFCAFHNSCLIQYAEHPKKVDVNINFRVQLFPLPIRWTLNN